MSNSKGNNAVNAIVRASLGDDRLAAVQRGLESVGVEGDGIKLALATAVAVGMEPLVLLNPRNLQALKQASDAMQVYGLLPGRHFYMMPFGREEERIYSFVLSIDYLDLCVRRWAIELGMGILPENRPVMNPDDARTYLDFWAHADWVDHPQNRVALSRYVPVVGGVRQIGINEGWESASVGYFLYDGYWVVGKNGNRYKTGGSEHMVRGRVVNRSPLNIAITRAQRAAARAITRTLYPVGVMDDRRMVELAAIAERKLVINPDDVMAATQEATEERLGSGGDGYADGYAEYTDVLRGDPPDTETPAPTEEPERPIEVVAEKPKKKGKKAEPAPEPALDLTPEDAAADIEIGEPAPEPDGATTVKTTLETWNDITSAVRASLPEDTLAWADGIAAAASGDPIKATKNNIANVRSWCGAFAKESAESQLDEGVTVGDAILATILGLPVGDYDGIDNRQLINFVAKTKKLDGNTNVQDPDGEGARHIRVIFAELKRYETSEWTA